MNKCTDNKRLAEHFAKSIEKGITEAFKEMLGLDEDRVVKFGGQTYPKFGQAVILSGGGGSGKGYAVEKYIPIDGKHIDVDHFKDLYIRLLNKTDSKVAKNDPRRQSDPVSNGDQLYDISNPQDTGALHIAVKRRNWKEKERQMFFRKDSSRDQSRLPNVILDITGTDPTELSSLADMCRECGYTVTLAWVVTSRDRAIVQALSRPRQIPQYVFHDAHNDILLELPPYIKSEAGAHFDYAWIIFNSSVGLSPKTKEEEINTSVQLTKDGRGFAMKPEDEKRLMDILGKPEMNPDRPQTYKDFDEVAPREDNYYVPLSDDEKNRTIRRGLTPKPQRRNHTLDKYGFGKTKAGDNLLKR